MYMVTNCYVYWSVVRVEKLADNNKEERNYVFLRGILNVTDGNQPICPRCRTFELLTCIST